MGKAYDRSYYPQGTGRRQLVAVMTQSNRKAALRDLKMPTLIIHGDSDPLVSVEAAKDAADAVPGAELIIMEGMGHDLPHGPAWTQIADHLIAHTKKSYR